MRVRTTIAMTDYRVPSNSLQCMIDVIFRAFFIVV